MIEEASPTKLAGLIPDVFYDVLARTVPGVLFLASLYLVVLPVSDRDSYLRHVFPSLSVGAATIIVLLVVTAGYIAGMLFEVLGRIITRSLYYHLWRNALSEDVKGSCRRIGIVPGDDLRKLDAFLTNFLIRHVTEAGLSLKKLRAEAAQGINLFVAFGGLCLLSGFVSKGGPALFGVLPLKVLVFASLAVMSLLMAWQRRRFLILHQLSYLSLAVSELPELDTVLPQPEQDTN